MVIEEHARLEILLPNEKEWRQIGESDIIQNSLSIMSKCMDDSSFSLGGAYSAQLSVKIRLDGTNSYNVTGAKIKVYSEYDTDEAEHLRGIFWATSVSRIKNIYTISASDSLIWLDSTSYDNSGNGENIIYNKLASDIGNLGYKLGQIIEIVNNLLDSENQLDFYNDSGIVNYFPSGIGYCILPTDMVGEISTKNPRDYTSWLAEIAFGFVYTDYSDGNVKVRIGQFDEEISDEITMLETELDSCEIADFTATIDFIYTDIYDGSSGSMGTHRDGIIINISENPFKDGHWQYNNGSAMDILANINDKLSNVTFRPFKLKCHCKKYFRLGQCITLPDSQKSVITSIKWQFRGGYTLSCAGKDTRILAVSAKRSQAMKAKDLSYTKINTEIAKLKKDNHLN